MAKDIITEAEAIDEFPPHHYEEREVLRQMLTPKESPTDRYNACREASVGDIISCPSCGKEMKKKSYQHVFCSNKGRDNCKDIYWNNIDPRRRARANVFANR